MSGNLTTTFIAAEARRLGFEVREGAPKDITGGAADSRKVRQGDLFTAFPGEFTDGNAYVEEALNRGAVAVVCSRPPAEAGDATVVIASETTRAIGQLAHAWRKTCDPRVVGITGTVGKTTAKDFTAAVLSSRFETHKSEGNLNSREGLPLALMSLTREHKVSVLEIAMDSRGEIAELAAIAEPEVGAVLNIGLTHVSKLGSIEAIAAEKLSLVRGLPKTGTAVVNADDPRVAAAISEIICPVISFGETAIATLRRGPVVEHGLGGTAFDVYYEDIAERVHSPLPGAHTVPAALCAIGVSLALGMNLRGAASAVANAEATGRARIARGRNGSTIIDDRYNSSPASLNGALDMLGKLTGRRVALIGRMAELGEYEEEEHRYAGHVAGRNIDALFAVGEECRVLVEAARSEGLADAFWFETKEDAATAVVELLQPGDTVLVKASRGAAFETILPLLEAQA